MYFIGVLLYEGLQYIILLDSKHNIYFEMTSITGLRLNWRLHVGALFLLLKSL